MAAKKQKEEAPASSLGWMVTFSDMVTLLLTFFVLLLSMCSLESQKVKQIQRVTLEAMGVLFEGERSELGVKTILSGKTKVLFDGERRGVGLRTIKSAKEIFKEKISETEFISERHARLKMKLAQEHLLGIVEFEETEKGIDVLLRNALLFNPGSAEINPGGTTLLSRIGRIIKNAHVDIAVEGHTDNVPISTERFPSNWELSIARAVSVVKFLAEEAGVSPVVLSAVGYGDTKPRASNDTPDNRSKNRRIEIVLAPKF
ncbi:MAG: flagellar motor protein MotB [Thermodesulfobacteriota bacterium]